MSLGEYKLPSINVMVTTVHFLAVQCISVWAARRDSVWFILLFNVFRTLFQEKQTTLSRLRQRGTEICRFTRETYSCACHVQKWYRKNNGRKKSEFFSGEMDCSGYHVTIEFDRSEFMNKWIVILAIISRGEWRERGVGGRVRQRPVDRGKAVSF